MDRKKETVIYRHPQGRYEVVEISGTDMFGGTYRYRETRRTPKRDARGLLRDEDLCAPAIRLTGAEQAEVGETARRKERIQYKGGARRPVTGAERAEICRLWEQGEPVRGIAERTGRAAGTVRIILNAEALRAEIAAEQAEAVQAAEERAAEALAKLEKVKNPAAHKVNFLFGELCEDWERLRGALGALAQTDEAAAGKMGEAIIQTVKGWTV